MDDKRVLEVKGKGDLADGGVAAVDEVEGFLRLGQREGMADGPAQVDLAGVDEVDDVLELAVLQAAAAHVELYVQPRERAVLLPERDELELHTGELGDQSIQNMSVRDTVLYAYTLTDDTGRVIVESDTLRTAYRQLPDGLQEVVRIAGDKGRFDAWLPSSTAYDTAGNAELGIAPDQLLNYRVDIIRIDYYNADRRR